MLEPPAGPGHLPKPPISAKGRDITILLSVLYTISLILVVLRFITKHQGKNVGLEDWLALSAFMCLTVYYGETIFMLTQCHAGFHATELNHWQIMRFEKVSAFRRAKVKLF